MNCDRSKALVSVYVDGELSEELAGPLRRHLMECSVCRASVSEAKALASWFVPGAPIHVPEGFAARVARLAVSGAGDAGVAASAAAGSGASGDDWLVPSRAPLVPRQVGAVQVGEVQVGAVQVGEVQVGAVQVGAVQRGSRAGLETESPAVHLRSVDRTARFAMTLAAMAAAVLIGLTLLLASDDGRGFDGSTIQAQPSGESALLVLEELNRREAAAVTAPQPPLAAPSDQETHSESEQPKSPR